MSITLHYYFSSGFSNSPVNDNSKFLGKNHKQHEQNQRKRPPTFPSSFLFSFFMAGLGAAMMQCCLVAAQNFLVMGKSRCSHVVSLLSTLIMAGKDFERY